MNRRYPLRPPAAAVLGGLIMAALAGSGAAAPEPWPLNQPETPAAATRPALAAAGELVYAAWEDRRDGRHDIFFSHSSDGGRTWPTDGRRLAGRDRDPLAPASNPQLAAAGGRVYAAWEERHPDGERIFFSTSENRGDLWRVPQRLNLADDGVEAPRLVVDDRDGVFIAWLDFSTTPAGIRARRSGDGGQTWQPPLDAEPLRLDVPGQYPYFFRLAAGGYGTLYAAWESADGSIHFNRSEDRGLNWQGAQTLHGDDGHGNGDNGNGDNGDNGNNAAAGRAALRRARAAGQTAPLDIATDGGRRVYVAWEAGGDGETGIFVAASADRGRTWLTENRRVNGDQPDTLRAATPRIAAADIHVYVAWVQENEWWADDIRFNFSRDGGRTWQSWTRRVNTNPADWAVRSANPLLVRNRRGDLFIVWEETAAGEILANRSDNHGSFWGEAARVNGGGPAANPVALAAADTLCVAWEEAVDQVTGVWFARGLSLPDDDQPLPPTAAARGGEGLCFIATAAFGDAAHPRVGELRRFRDGYLAHRGWGRRFIAWYYRHGPRWARRLDGRPGVRALVRLALRPLCAATRFF